MKKKKLYPISEITLENEKFVVKNFQDDPKKLITNEIKKLEENLKYCYINKIYTPKWFTLMTESRLIIRKLYSLIENL